MHRNLYSFLFLICAFFLFGCEKEEAPARPAINMDKKKIKPGEEITFKATGGNPLYHEWDFGNGVFSSANEKTVRFDAAGIYNVRLKTINANKEIIETSAIVIVGEIYFKGLVVYNFNFKAPDGKPWDEDGSGPDIVINVDSLEGQWPGVHYPDRSQKDFPLRVTDGPYELKLKVKSKFLTVKIGEYSLQGMRPISNWRINLVELVSQQSTSSEINNNNITSRYYSLPGNYPKVSVILSVN